MHRINLLLALGWLCLMIQPSTAQISQLPGQNSTGATAPANITAPQKTDTLFVINEGEGLDTGCTFRSGGPLTVQLPVDRYFGSSTERQALIDNGYLTSYATLTLPVYDIDNTAPLDHIMPEFNRLSVNGYVTETPYLYGQNNSWTLNRFRIPLDWLNFPADPGAGGTLQPALNEIRIDIDTANTDEFWCQSLDWVALEINASHPVALLSDTPSDWTSIWQPSLQQAGLPAVILQTNGSGQTINEQTTHIEQQLHMLRQRWGLQQIQLVTHGRSGLAAYQLAQQSDAIAQLIQIGTPNRGSPLVDVLFGSALSASFPPDSRWSAASLAEMTVTQRERVHQFDMTSTGNTRFFTLSGDYSFGQEGLADALLTNLAGSPHDGLIPRVSVHKIPLTNTLSISSSDTSTEALQFHQPESPAIYQMLRPYVLSPDDIIPSINPIDDTEIRTGINRTNMASHSGTLASSEEHTIQRQIQAQQALILLNYEGASPLLTLQTPSGTVIDPMTAAQSSGIDFIQTQAGMVGYALDAPESGVWSLSLTGGTAPAHYMLNGILFQPQTRLQLRSRPTDVLSGDTIIYEAYLNHNGTPLTGQTVSAQVITPDNTLHFLSLRDDGAGVDSTASDGIYSADFLTTQPGIHQTIAYVAGYNVQTQLETPVHMTSARLTGLYHEQVTDINLDGVYESLIINAEVESDSGGTYILSGTLHDTSGQFIGSTRTQASVTAGITTLSLTFDRTLLHNHTAPYMLRAVHLGDKPNNNQLMLLDSATDAYITHSYPDGSFKKPSIDITQIRDDLTDDDADNLYDMLTLQTDIHLPEDGLYAWSGTLVNTENRVIATAFHQGALQAGLQTIPFTFDGGTIRQSGLNGPYKLVDVLIYSDATSTLPDVPAQQTAAYSHQIFEHPLPPAQTNLTQNGNFSQNLQHWQTVGNIVASTEQDSLRLYRPLPSSDEGYLEQTLSHYFEKGLPVEIRLDVENTGSTGRGLLISLSDPRRIQVMHCALTLAPGEARQVILRDTTRLDWRAAHIQLQPYEPDSSASLKIDNVDIRYNPDSTATESACENTTYPVNLNLFVNSDFTNGIDYWHLRGAYEYAVSGTRLHLYRPADALQPTILSRNAAYAIPPGNTLQLQVELLNPDSQPAQIAVYLQDTYAHQSVYCPYTLPNTLNLVELSLALTTNRYWSQPAMRLDILSPDTTIQINDAVLKVQTETDPSLPVCSEPVYEQPQPTETPSNIPTSPIKPTPSALPVVGTAPPEPIYIPPTVQPMPIIGEDW